ncbi:uncharacterized protein LOC129871678 [Solanum dulcamara]|uniref:uncharacterized protein LOC129871678 n=1 Tax=Solanum dulcamara TaxID=45834 RepID=UPI00248538CC|nr:uncharacterized protein LOC129871678 [Solanum dulcamara]
MVGVEFEDTVDPTDVEKWLKWIKRVFEQLECSDTAKFKFRKSIKKGRFDSYKANTFRKLAQHKQNRSSSSTASIPTYGQGKARIHTCTQCGKNHFGTCRRASGACFNCGNFDHKVRDCPNPNPTSSPYMQGSIQKPITTPSQGNRGAGSRNTQTTSAGGSNQVSGLRAIA